jgi:hypothetical protein
MQPKAKANLKARRLAVRLAHPLVLIVDIS